MLETQLYCDTKQGDKVFASSHFNTSHQYTVKYAKRYHPTSHQSTFVKTIVWIFELCDLFSFFFFYNFYFFNTAC